MWSPINFSELQSVRYDPDYHNRGEEGFFKRLEDYQGTIFSEEKCHTIATWCLFVLLILSAHQFPIMTGFLSKKKKKESRVMFKPLHFKLLEIRTNMRH